MNLRTTEKEFLTSGKEICDRLVDAGMSLLQKQFPYFNVQSSCLSSDHLIFNSTPTIHIHHTGRNHFVTSTSIGGPVRIFDSLNLKPTDELARQITAIYSPDKQIVPTTIQVHISSTQQGPYDCGLFAIAYAVEVASNKDPSTVIFDQTKLRDHYRSCLESGHISPFHKLRINYFKSQESEITKATSKLNKWTFPKKVYKLPTSKQNKNSIQLNNRFSALDFINTKTMHSEKRSRHDKLHTTDCYTKGPNNPFKNNNQKSNVYNLSQHKLTEDEKLVLELGLSFCPSQKNFNREKFANDTHAFIRRLKLKEYFHERSQTDENFNNKKKEHSIINKDRCPLDWNIKNPHWYPEAVREGRSEGLVDFINSCTKGFSEHIHSKRNKHWNNLTDSQRQAIKSLSSDESIVIKPADKGSGIVIMNANDYNEACLNTLQDKEFYAVL